MVPFKFRKSASAARAQFHKESTSYQPVTDVQQEPVHSGRPSSPLKYLGSQAVGADVGGELTSIKIGRRGFRQAKAQHQRRKRRPSLAGNRRPENAVDAIDSTNRKVCA